MHPNPHGVDLTQGRYTESPLPLWERDRVRGLAREREEISRCQLGKKMQGDAHRPRSSCVCHQRTLRRLPAPDPSPCPSPTRGEGTLLSRSASSRKIVCSPWRETVQLPWIPAFPGSSRGRE